MRTIVHCSDLHFGRTDQSVVEALKIVISKIKPDLLIVSGDLTQRARTNEFAQARAFLLQVKVPQVVIPGNHDVALYNLFSRFFSPFNSYKEWVQKETNRHYSDSEINVASINTAHGWTIDSGRLTPAELNKVSEQWKLLPANVLKILVTHHPIDLSSLKRKFAWGKDTHVAGERVVPCKPDILCSGHLHGTASFVEKGCIQVAAGTATSTRLRKEANSFNLIKTQKSEVLVQSFSWDGNQFNLASEARFFRCETGWQADQSAKYSHMSSSGEGYSTKSSPRPQAFHR